MRQTIIIVAIVLMFCTVTAGARHIISGSSKIETKHYDLRDFDKIKLDSITEFQIVPSLTYGIDVTTDDNIMGYVEVSKSGNQLTVKLNSGYRYRPTELKVIISTPDISMLSLYGKSEGKMGYFSFDHDVAFRVRGLSSLEIASLSAENAYFNITGDSKFTADVRDFEGTADFTLHGGEVDISLFGCDEAEVIMNATDSESEAVVALYSDSCVNITADNAADLSLSLALFDESSAYLYMDGEIDVSLHDESSLSYVGELTFGEKWVAEDASLAES
jgi:hypothetical protein